MFPAPITRHCVHTQAHAHTPTPTPTTALYRPIFPIIKQMTSTLTTHPPPSLPPSLPPAAENHLFEIKLHLT